jgi:hypothetical protein
MAKGPSRFAGQNSEEAMQVTNYGMNWMREIAEQNLNQSRVLLEGLLTITRKAIDDIDHQSSEFRHRSMLLAEETLSNAFDFAHKAVRAREPQEIAQLQSEFASRQAQTIIDQGKELGQSIMQKTNEMAKTTNQVAAEASRGRFEAA